MEFLAEDNIAGQTLLNLVARGSSIIAELLRLSDNIPAAYAGTDQHEVSKYAPILLDFSYLRNPEYYDEKIDSNADVVDIDEEFRETHLALLERFYKVFESIYKYQKDFNTYLEEMIEGVFVQHTIEGVLMDPEGKQLMSEALYLYGVMLLMMDLRVPGHARETMIISYYRYKGAATVHNIDEVAKLCRSTGFHPDAPKKPDNYPELLFERFPVPHEVVQMIVGRLRSDDIYNRNSAYPAPQHRSTALSSQASMLYVILYFVPDFLHKKSAVMREVVDKHFNDNWVIPFYMGYTVDLTDAWLPYKAAAAALKNIVEKENVIDIIKKHVENVHKLKIECDKYLTEGVLVEEYVLDNVRKLLHCVRSCNATLRWAFLHRTTTHKKFHEMINKHLPSGPLLDLLMKTAQFEFVLKEMFGELIAAKQDRWAASQKEASERMLELSEYFSGEKALTRVKKNEKLQSWFKKLSEEIQNLEYTNSTFAGRKIQALMNALEEVEEFHQMTSLQVKSFLDDTREFLQKMIRTVNVREKTVADLDIISDFSYASHIIESYTPMIHERIKQNPSVVLLLRATFLKLSSLLSIPLVRITQCESSDAVSVAEFFSTMLVKYVRKVLDIIPRSVFALLAEISTIMTNELRPVPSKLEREHLKDVSQLPERYKLARATHQVSVFAEGILAMKTTLVGIIQLDPRQLLEDGIRKQLVQQICVALNEHLVFKSGKLEEFEDRLQKLGQALDGLRSSFVYIQDYINMYGLKIWQEEFSRIVNYYVEQESNQFLKRKILDHQSSYQSDAIPIPRFQRLSLKQNGQNLSVNFMGRLAMELMSQTDPRRSIYIESHQGWYSDGREVVGIRTFDILNRAVGVFGLTGLDKLISFFIVRDLHSFLRMYRKSVGSGLKGFVSQFANALTPTTQFPQHSMKIYSQGLSHTSDLWGAFLEFTAKIGQAQLIRRQISNELNFTCKMDAKLMSCALDVMNKSLISEVKAHYSRPDVKPYPTNEVLFDVSQYLEAGGYSNPITKIYITSEIMQGVPELMFLFVLSQIETLQWNKQMGKLLFIELLRGVGGGGVALSFLWGLSLSSFIPSPDSRLTLSYTFSLSLSLSLIPLSQHPTATLVAVGKGQKSLLDGAPFIVGVITILKQFHSHYTDTFLAYLGQYIRCAISVHSSKGSATSLPPVVINLLLFLEEYCRFSSTPRSAIENHIPSYIFDRFTR